jgi:hypothetical protein
VKELSKTTSRETLFLEEEERKRDPAIACVQDEQKTFGEPPAKVKSSAVIRRRMNLFENCNHFSFKEIDFLVEF